jgi:hypothetical protein
MFKTTRDHAQQIVQEVVANSALAISTSCHTGTIHFYCEDRMYLNRVADTYRVSILERGGELHSRHWPLPSVIESERHWFEVLSAAFHFSGANAHA